MKYYNELNGKYFKTLSGLVRSLRKLGIDSKTYYDRYIKKENEEFCDFCHKEMKFSKFHYPKFCNHKCYSDYYHGIPKGPMSDETKQKLSKAWESRDVEAMHAKRVLTIEAKYGIDFKSFKRNQFNIRLQNMSEEEHEAFYDKATSSRHGNGYKFKKYILNGEEILIQGYENIVLDLLKKYYDESSIKSGRNIGFIRYIDSTGKKRRYFPDIVINDNILIEVKSSYTLSTDKEILSKLKAANAAGYKVLLCVLDVKQIEMFEKDLIETISSQVLKCEERFNDYPFIGVGYKQKITEVLGIH